MSLYIEIFATLPSVSSDIIICLEKRHKNVRNTVGINLVLIVQGERQVKGHTIWDFNYEELGCFLSLEPLTTGNFGIIIY